jgi:hypothetical protein
MRRHGEEKTGWAARYRVMLLLWALALVLLSNSMLGDVKSANVAEEELAGPGQIQHRALNPLSSRHGTAQKPEPKVPPPSSRSRVLSGAPPSHRRTATN